MRRYVAGTKECPFCAETIKAAAKKCIHCGEHLDLDEGRFRWPWWLGWLGIKGKSAWDLLSLIGIPLMLLIVGYLLSNRQAQNQLEIEGTRIVEQRRIEGTRIVEQRRIEEARIAAQSTIEADRANANALQLYLDDISPILLQRNLENEKVKTAAQARTVTILSELDSKRNNSVIRFLEGSEMIKWILVDADLSEANLVGADLSRAGLAQAKLNETDLSFANLYKANLHEANLRHANLRHANLRGADLRGANLQDATLSDTNVAEALYDDATSWPDEFEVQEKGALFIGLEANLSNAYLVNTNLGGANLGGADLSRANMSGANLGDADLSGTRYTTETIWPDGFDPKAAGAILVDDEGKPIEDQEQ